MRKTFFNGHRNSDIYSKEKMNGLVEDTTEYGEFIASFDAWMTPEEQKKRVEHLQNIGKKKK